MNIREKIIKFLEEKNISKKEFYENIEVSDGFLNKNGGINSQIIEKIHSSYPELDLIWLITGQGSMFKNEKIHLSIEDGIPLIPINAMAGFGTGEFQIDLNGLQKFNIPTFKGADYLIQIKGSSMYPKYNSGDIVACQKLLLNDMFYQWNKVYVLDTDQGALIKRVKKGKDEEHLLLVSDNTSYEPFDLHLSKIYAVALVIGVIRLE